MDNELLHNGTALLILYGIGWFLTWTWWIANPPDWLVGVTEAKIFGWIFALLWPIYWPIVWMVWFWKHIVNGE